MAAQSAHALVAGNFLRFAPVNKLININALDKLIISLILRRRVRMLLHGEIWHRGTGAVPGQVNKLININASAARVATLDPITLSLSLSLARALSLSFSLPPSFHTGVLRSDEGSNTLLVSTSSPEHGHR
jgi:hypothetical protein